jgi:hypothetical protein
MTYLLMNPATWVEAIQVLVARGKWLYRFIVLPANSTQRDSLNTCGRRLRHKKS